MVTSPPINAFLVAVRAKDQAEVWRALVARSAFVRRVVADPRTVALFDHWRRVGATKDERVTQVLRFICRDLYTTQPRLVGWLSVALMDYFDDPSSVTLPAGTFGADALVRGQRPDSDKIERYVEWYYRNRVAVPPVPYAELAREYVAARAAEGVFVGAKDDRGIKEQPDSKLVRNRVREADRLLNDLAYPIPPLAL